MISSCGQLHVVGVHGELYLVTTCVGGGDCYGLKTYILLFIYPDALDTMDGHFSHRLASSFLSVCAGVGVCGLPLLGMIFLNLFRRFAARPFV
jgi:hypothetical protein